jgi:predicted RecA/RadA family phage recombinase
MRNYVQKGLSLTVTAPRNVNSGDGVQIGAGLFGVAVEAASAGSQVDLLTEGVFSLPLDSAAMFSQGDVAYWDATADAATNTATISGPPLPGIAGGPPLPGAPINLLKIGYAIAATAPGATAAIIRLVF